MTTSSDKPFKDDRRTFLKSATAVGISLGLPSTDARSEMSSSNEAQATAVDSPDEDGYTPEQRKRYFVDAPGSDFMVRVLASLGIEYIAVNPGASFRGLHESLINSSDSAKPQIITCLHEEQAVAFAHGYAKVTGKPMAVACHGTVGFQHASMAVYNAWCDKVPILILGGNHRDAASRPFPVLWDHSAQDPVAAIRDATKWDDQPASLQHFAESTVRAYRVAITPPMGPVAIAIDSDLQERPVDGDPQIPRLSRVLPLQGDPGAVHEAAAQLVSAEAPVIVVERYAGSQEGINRLVELAELLQAVVIDRGARMNMRSTAIVFFESARQEPAAPAAEHPSPRAPPALARSPHRSPRRRRGRAAPASGSPDRPAAATAQPDRPRPSAPFVAGKGPDSPSAPSLNPHLRRRYERPSRLR